MADITKDWLESNGFKRQDGNAFKNIILPYYVNNAVCLFFNESPPLDTYLIGYGFNHMSDYYASTFRWVTDTTDVRHIYHAITGKYL